MVSKFAKEVGQKRGELIFIEVFKYESRILLNMILGAIFWTDASNFDPLKKLLIEEFHLVQNYLFDPDEPTEYLVYENPELVSGIQHWVYRIYFKREHRLGSHIALRYWQLRINEKIIEADPMKFLLIKTYQFLKPVRVTDFSGKNLDLETLISS